MLFNFKFKSFSFALLFLASFSFAQTGIGTSTPHASAKLEVASTTQGFLPPRVALTATNLASPISNPANGLMVFNTASAGASPFNVVPGYYFWDGTGQQWVSLSTTVGNVQNQALFRSSSNTSAGQAITSWNSRFNNIASGDLTVNSSTTFTLSNGLYKIEWALPFQSTNTYNSMQLQELSSGNWGPFRGDGGYATLSNGGNTDWGGGTFAADILDCSSGSKTIRIINNDGASRTLFYGVNLIITKLNPSITTSTTADNLGDHTATKNILLNNNFLSNDGDNEGIRIDNSGNVGIGTVSPTEKLDVSGNIKATNFIGGEIPIYLSANKSSAQSIPHNIETIVTNWDGAGWFNNFPTAWNSTTGAWTCPRAGIYEFFFSAMLNSHAPSGIGNEFAVILSLNGVLQSIGDFWSQTTSTTRTPHASTNLIMSLNVGDIVTPRIYQNLTTNTAINTQPGRLYFQVKQLPSRINRQ